MEKPYRRHHTGNCRDIVYLGFNSYNQPTKENLKGAKPV